MTYQAGVVSHEAGMSSQMSPIPALTTRSATYPRTRPPSPAISIAGSGRRLVGEDVGADMAISHHADEWSRVSPSREHGHYWADRIAGREARWVARRQRSCSASLSTPIPTRCVTPGGCGPESPTPTSAAIPLTSPGSTRRDACSSGRGPRSSGRKVPPRLPWSAVVRRPDRPVALALAAVAVVLLAALPAVTPIPFGVGAVAAAIGSAAWAVWATREVLGDRADHGHRIAALALTWLPIASAQVLLSAGAGASLVPVLPLFAVPLVAAVAAVNPGAGLWRPIGGDGPAFSRDACHQPAGEPVVLEVVQPGRDVVEADDVHDRRHVTGGQERVDGGHVVLRPAGRAEQLRLLVDDVHGVEGDLHAGHAHHDDPAVLADRLEGPRRRRPVAGVVDDEVEALAGPLEHVADDGCCADLARHRPDRLVDLGDVHLGTAHHGDPGPDLAEAAKADDADLHPRSGLAPRHHRVVRRHARIGAQRGQFERQSVGHRHDVVGRAAMLLGEAAVACVPRCAVPVARADADAVADADAR